MTAYYNEHDPKAAAWLRELIARGHIAPGVVDERSIENITADDLAGFVQCHFFAGIGVWSYAIRLADLSGIDLTQADAAEKIGQALTKVLTDLPELRSAGAGTGGSGDHPRKVGAEPDAFTRGFLKG